MKRIVLVNPNTSEALTMMMVEIAREYASAGLYIDGLTVSFGPPLITCDTELDEAARSVLSVAPELAKRADAVIIGAFGDPDKPSRHDLPVFADLCEEQPQRKGTRL